MRTGFESLQMCTIVILLSLLLACSSRCELSAVLLLCTASCCDGDGLLSLRSHELSEIESEDVGQRQTPGRLLMETLLDLKLD